MRSHRVLSPLAVPEQEQLRELSRLLAEEQAGVRGAHGSIHPLPPSLSRFLQDVLRDLQEGRSVAVFTQDQELTTAQAARLLGLSRQYLCNLMDRGEIAHHRAGTHRRVYLRDLLAYRQRRDHTRHEALNALSRAEMEEGLYDRVPLMSEQRGE